MKSKIVFKNVMVSILAQIVIIISGFIIPKLLLSTYGSDNYGLTVSIAKFLGYISLLEGGFGVVIKAALYKPIAEDNKEKILSILKSCSNFFKKLSYIFLIYICLLCFIFPLFVSNKFDVFYTISLILIIAISTFFEYCFGMTYGLFLKSKEKNYVVSYIQILTYILNIILILILTRLNLSIHVVKLFGSMIFVLRPIIQNMYVKKKYNISLKNIIVKQDIKGKWDGLTQHVAAVVNDSIDVTLLTFFGMISEISIYSVYYMIVSSIKQLIISVSTGIESTLGSLIAKGEYKNLRHEFETYEFIYYSINTIFYSCSLILIVQFVKIYTIDITDTNYINYAFGYIITLAIYIYTLRAPYYSLIMASGNVKQTKRDAFIEAILNLILSLILINKYGIVGLAIGSLVAMTYRTIAIMIYSSKQILVRKLNHTFKKLIFSLFQMTIIYLIYNLLLVKDVTNYMSWIILALATFIVATVVVFIFSMIFYKREIKECLEIIKNVFKRKKVNK